MRLPDRTRKSKVDRDKIQNKIRYYRSILHSLEALDDRVDSSLYITAGLVLRDIRAEKLVTQRMLCETLGLSQATLSQIENGRYNTGLHRYLELLDALNVDISDFIDRIGKKAAESAQSKANS